MAKDPKIATRVTIPARTDHFFHEEGVASWSLLLLCGAYG
jgi:hypothetical protein